MAHLQNEFGLLDCYP